MVAALLGNLAVAVTKLGAAAITGSAAMFAEAVHSVVDTGNEVLLLYGYRQAAKRPDAMHPFGYGREIYFWSFIVALLIFGLGAGVAIYQGVRHVMAPEPSDNLIVSYVVLGLAFVFEGMSWRVAYRNFRAARQQSDFWHGFRSSKDSPAFVVLFEDSAALVGIVIALIGIFLADVLNAPVIDGIASICIGLVLAGTATMLAIESKSLLLGETITPELAAAVSAIAVAQPQVRSVNGVLGSHLAPEQVLLSLSLEFEDDLVTQEIERCVTAIESEVQQLHPQVVALFVKPQSPGDYAVAFVKRFGESAAETKGGR